MAISPVPQRSIYQWFDTSAFVFAPLYTFGNSETRTLIMPGLFNIDFNMKKAFRFTESRQLEFRAEFFNIMNHTNFDMPGNTLGSANFGVISGCGTGARFADEPEIRFLKGAGFRFSGDRYVAVSRVEKLFSPDEAGRLELVPVQPCAIVIGLSIVTDAEQDLVFVRNGEVAQVCVQHLGILE